MRTALGVIIGYILMFVLQVAAFMIIYTVMGANWSFEPASYQASTQWTVMQFVVVFVTAAIAGLLCALIARGGKATLVLAAVVLARGRSARRAPSGRRGQDDPVNGYNPFTYMEPQRLDVKHHETFIHTRAVFGGKAVFVGRRRCRRTRLFESNGLSLCARAC